MLMLMKPCDGYGQTNADGTSNFPVNSRSSVNAREVKKMAFEMVREEKLGKEQAEDQFELLRQIGQQVLQEATKQKVASISNPLQVLYDALEKRRKVVQKIRDDYERMIKNKFRPMRKSK